MVAIGKRFVLMCAALFAGIMLLSSPAAAQATRTWVSGVGDDVNPCSRTAPCKTFAGAISKTAPGGEINCLDPAGFGTLTITKSITVDCTGTFGSVLASSTTGFIVNAAATDVIVLRGLSINGAPPTSPGVNGIRVLAAGRVLVENVSIVAFGSSAPNGFGILINPNTGNVQVSVVNSTISGNANGGISVNPAGAVPATLVVRNTKFIGNGGAAIGLTTAGGGTALSATVSDSLLAGNSIANSSGVIAKATTGTATILVTSSEVSGNTSFGVNSNGAGAVVRVSASSITTNGTGVNTANSGQAISYGNNVLAGNTNQGAFSSTVPTN
jgi:hypothetical protein